MTHALSRFRSQHPRHRFCFGCVVLAWMLSACSSENAGTSSAGAGGTSGSSGGTGGTGGTGGDTPLPDPAKQCIRPEAPSISGTAQIVGDGTPESCTEAAVQAALDNGGTVEFDCGQSAYTIALTKRLMVRASVAIVGGGKVTLDGQGVTRILDMDQDNTAAPDLTLVLQGLELTRGNADLPQYTSRDGGAILTSYRGSLYVEDCVFRDNSAGNHGEEGGGALGIKSEGKAIVVASRFANNRAGVGAGIRSLLSELTVIDSVFDGNDSTGGAQSGTQNGQPGGGYGAAVYVDGTTGRVATLCGDVFSGNQSTGQGGAVFMFTYGSAGEKASIEACTFRDNELTNDARNDSLGGAIRHGGGGELRLSSSTFWNNHALVQGGALWVGENSPAVVSNCTFVANRVEAADGGGLGGAVLNAGGAMLLSHVTMVGNYAGFEGGAVEGDDKITVEDSIIAFNTAGNPWGNKQNCGRGGDLGDAPPPAFSGGNNIEFPAIAQKYNNPTCASGAIEKDPKVEMVPTDHGGPTLTCAIDASSPAVGIAIECPAVDQRGEERKTPCDLGAFELLP